MNRALKITKGVLAVTLFTIYTVLLTPLFLAIDFLDWCLDGEYSKNAKGIWRHLSAPTERDK